MKDKLQTPRIIEGSFGALFGRLVREHFAESRVRGLKDRDLELVTIYRADERVLLGVIGKSPVKEGDAAALVRLETSAGPFTTPNMPALLIQARAHTYRAGVKMPTVLGPWKTSTKISQSSGLAELVSAARARLP